MLLNEFELVGMALQSKGVISDETIVANHPWVDDPAEEIKKLDKQKEGYINLDGTGNNNGGQGA
jgi:hypothetical protein